MSKTDDPNIKFLVNEETINFRLFGHIILDWIICNTYGWLICNTYLVRSFNLLRRYFTQNISLNLWDKALYLAYAVVIRYTGLFLDSLWHQISPHKHTIAGRRSSIILTTNPIKITIAIHLKMSTLCKPQPLFFWCKNTYINKTGGRLIKSLPVPLGTLLRKRVRKKPAARGLHSVHTI
jgi:hypothetical protein